MTKREARRIAYRNIIDGIASELHNGAEYWVTDPTTHQDLPDADAKKVEQEAWSILRSMERRAR